MKPSTILTFLALALPFASATSRRRHHDVARLSRADTNADGDAHVDIDKRSFTQARFTFYDDGLGACGAYSEPDQMIVALNVEQFGPGYPGEYCFKPIGIAYEGKTVNATIVDKCMGCPYGGLDFSRGLFDQFAEEAVGVLYGEWWFY